MLTLLKRKIISPFCSQYTRITQHSLVCRFIFEESSFIAYHIQYECIQRIQAFSPLKSHQHQQENKQWIFSLHRGQILKTHFERENRKLRLIKAASWRDGLITFRNHGVGFNSLSIQSQLTASLATNLYLIDIKNCQLNLPLP